ncbi:GlxA family transcriptional regulator [Ruegeria sp. R13_0]|uniref:GlxA family transcriptional regulator n=1 Tax=Ruegeria sp. R13_0 TaxID=2821099 RepID=UPI001ADC7D60|nr:GlxA family transcriptional regulator [Ruegeria sp. R13_0]MBO9436467.1 GlxA family transcriptional regulator [Ruegeria sp. R13_0]
MTQQQKISVKGSQPAKVASSQRYIFLLLRSCSAFDVCAAVEALKDANRTSDDIAYDWVFVSDDGSPCLTSGGIELPVECDLFDLKHRDTLLVFGGEAFAQAATPKVLSWLRKQARIGVTIGGISSGVHTLLKAGVLPNEGITTHWNYRSVLQEQFEDIDIGRALYSLNGNRFTCAGGLATVDLMLHLIARDNGAETATWVADNLVCSAPRSASQEQTISQCSRIGDRNTKVSEAVDIMLDTLETPISPSQIADEVGISTRQLERLFNRHMNVSPKVYYMRLRIEKARMMLLQTNLKTIEVAIACGFNSPSHFSKIYRKHFGMSPYRERGFHGGMDNERSEP